LAAYYVANPRKLGNAGEQKSIECASFLL